MPEPANPVRLPARWAAEVPKAVTLRGVNCGTEIEILHEGLPSAIPAEMCYLGRSRARSLPGSSGLRLQRASRRSARRYTK